MGVAKGSSLPQPQEVEGITDACSFKEGGHDIDTERGYLVVETAGADGDCTTSGDNGYAVVDLTNLKAQTLGSKLFLTFLYDGNRKVEKVLLFDPATKSLQLCNPADVSSCEEVSLPFTPTSATLLLSTQVYRQSKGKFDYFYCFDFGSGANLYQWDNHQLTALPGGDCSGWIGMTADGQRVYGTDGSSIYSYSGGSRAQIVSGAGNIIFYAKYSGSSDSACYWEATDTPSSPVCFTGAYWAGIDLKSSGQVSSMTGGALIVKGGHLYYAKVDSLKDETSWQDMGVVDSNEKLLFWGYGSCLLGEGTNTTDFHTDVYFVNLDKEGSLVKVTDTPSEDEEVISLE